MHSVTFLSPPPLALLVLVLVLVLVLLGSPGSLISWISFVSSLPTIINLQSSSLDTSTLVSRTLADAGFFVSCAFLYASVSALWMKLETHSAGLEEEGKEGTSPSWRPAAVLWGVHPSSASSLLRVLRAERPLPTRQLDMPLPGCLPCAGCWPRGHRRQSPLVRPRRHHRRDHRRLRLLQGPWQLP